MEEGKKGTQLTSSQLGKISVISRLYELIHCLPEEMQMMLLKQLLRYELPDYIFKLILDMTDNQRMLILNQLEEMVLEKRLSVEDEMSIINLDERTDARKRCIIFVECSTEEELSFKECIHDISISGAFIKTDKPIRMGQRISLSFSIPDFEKSFEMMGEVVRCNGDGIGVRFVNLSDKQKGIMKSFIESMDTPGNSL